MEDNATYFKESQERANEKYMQADGATSEKPCDCVFSTKIFYERLMIVGLISLGLWGVIKIVKVLK